jgi:hypothetical protein
MIIHPCPKHLGVFLGNLMKLYGINFFCNYKQHAEAIWAIGRYELEKQILAQYPKATGIYIWLI